MLPNHVDYVPIVLGVTLCGANVTALNPLYTTDEVRIVLERSKACVVVTGTTSLDVAMASARGTEVKQIVVVPCEANHDPVAPEETIPLESLADNNNPVYATIMEKHESTYDMIAALPFSSGTTGLPKGVCLSHSNLVANLHQVDLSEGKNSNPEDIYYTPLPFFHIYGFLIPMLYPAWQGSTLITTSGRYDLKVLCQLVQEHKPTRGYLAPPILLGIAKDPIVQQYDLTSIQTIKSGAAPLGKESETALKEILPNCTIKQGWGMTELSPLGTVNDDDDIREGSIGHLVSSTLGKVMDEEGNSLGPDQDGEICIKGPQVMKGYMVRWSNNMHCII